eukprot:10167113-Alexandrium_andersonii.AAC.1
MSASLVGSEMCIRDRVAVDLFSLGSNDVLQPSPPFDSVFGEVREVSGEARAVNAEGALDLEAAKNF